MKAMKLFPFLVFAVFLTAAAPAKAETPAKAEKPQNKLMSFLITRVENHTNTRNADGNFNSEVFLNTMIVSNAKLTERVIASVFALNRRSISDNDAVTNAFGINGIIVFNKRSIGMVGYSYSSNAERTAFTPGARSDRLSFSSIYTFNPEEKKKPQYALTTSYGTLTNWGDQQSLSEKVGMKFPIKGEDVTGSLSYRYSYDLNSGEQSSNQVSGQVAVKLKNSRLSFGLTKFNNVFSGNRGDDTVFDITWTYTGL